MNIWQFNTLLTRRLFSLNVINFATGLVLSQKPEPIQRGNGMQAVGWAAVNFAIALFGWKWSQKRAAKPDALDKTVLAKETRNLRRILWFNAALDVGYMLGGWWYTQRESERPFRWGSGLGIIIQGMMLLIFDAVHALQVPDTER